MTPELQTLILSLKTVTKPVNSRSKTYRVRYKDQSILLQGKKGYTEEQIIKELEENFKGYPND